MKAEAGTGRWRGARRPGTATGLLAAVLACLLGAAPLAAAPGDPFEEGHAIGFGALEAFVPGIPPPSPGRDCADTDDEYDELWTGSSLQDGSLPFLVERVTRRHFEEAIRGRFLQVSERGPSGVALFVTNEGRAGRLLYRWRRGDGGGEATLELHRIVLLDPTSAVGISLPPHRLRPGEQVDLDPPGDGWGAGPDLRHVRTPFGPVFEALDGSELRIATASLCGA